MKKSFVAPWEQDSLTWQQSWHFNGLPTLALPGSNILDMQIPLELKLPVKADFDDFVSPQKPEIYRAIEALLQTNEHMYLYFGAQSENGKTHLLGSICQLAEKAGKSVIYLPLKNAISLSVAICEGLEEADIVCIDDIDAIAGKPDWELALFNLYNNIISRNHQLVISGNNSPANLNIVLKDLKSRLAWGITIFIKALNDQDKSQILQTRAVKLGMPLPSETINYLLTHHSRTMNKLLQTLDLLERASMAAKRKLTVPFVKSVLEN
jgi:DnaA-homolog protein